MLGKLGLQLKLEGVRMKILLIKEWRFKGELANVIYDVKLMIM